MDLPPWLKSILSIAIPLIGIFMLMKKFFPDNGLVKMISGLFGGGDDAPEKAAAKTETPDAPAKIEKIDVSKVFEKYMDKNGDGKVDGTEFDIGNLRLSKVIKGSGKAIDGTGKLDLLELSEVESALNRHRKELEPYIANCVQQNGTLTDEGFDNIALQLNSLMKADKAKAQQRH